MNDLPLKAIGILNVFLSGIGLSSRGISPWYVLMFIVGAGCILLSGKGVTP